MSTVTRTTCDKCSGEISGIGIRNAATVALNDSDGYHMSFDLCAACVPLLGEFFGLNKAKDRDAT